MSGTAGRHKMFDAMSPVTVALLLDRRLIEQWPFEYTKRAWAFLRSAPGENVYRRALLGDESGIITGIKDS